MSRKIALVSLIGVALCFWAVAAEEFPDADIQWILDQYKVSEPVSLIAAEGLTGWTRTGGGEIAPQSKWTNKEGKLTLEFSERTKDFQGGDIVTAKQYTNFVLDFSWNAARRCNSGIKYRVKDFGATGATHARGWLGCEYQILDDFNRGEGASDDGRFASASLYFVFAPDKDAKKLNPHGEKNTGRIIVLDNRIEHWLNGKKVLQCEVGNEAWKQAIVDSKFAKAEGEGYAERSFGFGENRTGFLLLQDHGGSITFEKIVIREIGEKR